MHPMATALKWELGWDQIADLLCLRFLGSPLWLLTFFGGTRHVFWGGRAPQNTTPAPVMSGRTG